MGLLWAARFSQAGIDCTVLQRSGKSEPSRPLAFKSINDAQHTNIPLGYLPLDKVAEQSIIHIVVATKAYDLLEAIDSVLPALADNVKVICLGNGIGAQHALIKKLRLHSNDSELYWALSNDGAIRSYLEEQTCITQTGFGTTYIGRLGNKSPRDTSLNRLEDLSRLFLDIRFVDSVEPYIWKKFFINCAINPLTAYYDCKNGELLANTEYKQQFEALVDEIETVSKNIDWSTLGPGLIKDHHRKHDETEPSDLRQAIYQVIEQTAENYSSMCIDFRQQRPDELDFLNAYLIQLANSFKISLPINQRLLEHLVEKRSNN